MVERAKRGPDAEFRAMVIETLKIQTASIAKIQDEVSSLNKAVIAGDKEQIGIMGRMEFLTLTVAEVKENLKNLTNSVGADKDARNKEDKNQTATNTQVRVLFTVLGLLGSALLIGFASGVVKFAVPNHAPASIVGTR